MPAPPRFIGFALVLLAAGAIAIPWLGWRLGFMAAFDLAALAFLVSCVPLLRHEPGRMRETARRNDANRAVLLGVTAVVMLAILAIVAGEITGAGAPGGWVIGLIVLTLALAWTFSNTVYALHYAHLYYSAGGSGADHGGLSFPQTDEPDYWDFVYFAFCLGMTFQTSDVTLTDRDFRRTVTMQCLAAFVFNLGILGFTINVLSQ